jgi:hypothetical protein
MRAHKLREEASEKERGEHFNTIQPIISTKQEWGGGGEGEDQHTCVTPCVMKILIKLLKL